MNEYFMTFLAGLAVGSVVVSLVLSHDRGFNHIRYEREKLREITRKWHTALHYEKLSFSDLLLAPGNAEREAAYKYCRRARIEIEEELTSSFGKKPSDEKSPTTKRVLWFSRKNRPTTF